MQKYWNDQWNIWKQIGINENLNSTANKGADIENDQDDDDKDEEEKQLTEELLSEPDYSFFMFINELSGSKRAMDLVMLKVIKR